MRELSIIFDAVRWFLAVDSADCFQHRSGCRDVHVQMGAVPCSQTAGR